MISSSSRIARWSARWPYGVYGILSVLFCGPLFTSPNGLGILDWDQHLFYYGSVIKSVVEYGQFPFWNPWYCGGNVLWQNPQIPLLSPALPLATIVSLPLAMKINIVLHYWLGFAGMHLLLTSAIGLTFVPAVIYLATVGTLSGAMAMHLAVGHSVFLPCLYLPLQLYFCIRAFRTGAFRDMACGGMLLALMIYNGALHVVPMSVGAIGGLAFCAAVGRRDWRPLAAGVLLVVLGVAYAAPKLIPVTLWVSSDRFVDARTVLQHPDRMSVEMVLRTYLDPYQTRGLHFGPQRSGWYEYGNYIGALGALLIAAAILWTLIVRGGRERWLGVSLACTALVLLVLSAGEFAWWAPASLATHVPLFSSFRIPSRYTLAFVTVGVATVAWALRDLGADTSLGPRARALLTIVCILGSLDLLVQNQRQFAGAFSLAPLTHAAFPPLGGVKTLAVDSTSNPYSRTSPMFTALMNDRAFYRCYESLQTRRNATAAGPLVSTDGPAKIVDTAFTPNRVEFSVIGGREPSEVALNENFAYGWTSSAGPIVASKAHGQPAVVLRPGQTGTFSFTFVPPGLVPGMVIFLAATLASALAWRRRFPASERDRGE